MWQGSQHFKCVILVINISCIVEEKKNIKWLYLYIYVVNRIVNVVVVVVYFETKVHAIAVAVPTPKWTHKIVVIIQWICAFNAFCMQKAETMSISVLSQVKRAHHSHFLYTILSWHVFILIDSFISLALFHKWESTGSFKKIEVEMEY